MFCVQDKIVALSACFVKDHNNYAIQLKHSNDQMLRGFVRMRAEERRQRKMNIYI